SQLLATAAREHQNGVNVLLHGVPGVGKTEFVKLVAATARISLLEVPIFDAHSRPLDDKGRLAAYRLAQAAFNGAEHIALLVDDADGLLATAGWNLLADGSPPSKAAANQMLESNALPALWVCNDISCIDAAQLRRF